MFMRIVKADHVTTEKNCKLLTMNMSVQYQMLIVYWEFTYICYTLFVLFS